MQAVGGHDQEYFTYRLTKLPKTIVNDSLGNLFYDEVRQAITATSVGTCVYHPDEFTTATVTFKGRQDMESLIKQEFAQVQVDDAFYGLTPLNTAAGTPKANIVAIPGLAGRAFESWQTQNGQMWLRDYLAPKHSDCRYFTYGYPSKLRRSPSQAIIAMFVENFVTELKMIKPGPGEPAPLLVLIGHSLGCIIVKDAMVQSTSLSASPPRLCQSVCGIVFFGAPHRGLDNPELMHLVRGTPPDDLVRDLRPNSSLLYSLNQAFPEACKDVKIISCYETEHTHTYQLKDPSNPQSTWEKTGPLRFVVPPASACLYWAAISETRIAIHQDHSSIARLNDASGSAYYRIEPEIKNILDAAPNVMKKRQRIGLGPQSVLNLFFMLQYEYYWFRAWSGHISQDLLNHGNTAEAFGKAGDCIRLLNLPFEHPARSIVDSVALIMDLLGGLVNQHREKYEPQKHLNESRLMVSGEGRGDRQTYLHVTSVQLSLDLKDQSDHENSESASDEYVYRLGEWSESHQEQFTFLLSKFHLENQRLSHLSRHAASIELLAASKVINEPETTLQDLEKIEKISPNKTLYTSLAERASTRRHHLDTNAYKDNRVPEYPLSRIRIKPGTGSSNFRELLPSSTISTAENKAKKWVFVEWLKFPFPLNLDSKRDVEKQIRQLAYKLSFPDRPLLLKTLQCAGLVEDLGEHRYGLLFSLFDWIDVTREPVTLHSLLSDVGNDSSSISPPSFDERLQLGRCLAYSVAELHSAGIVHKNINPQNLLVFPRRFSQNISISDAFICGLEYSRPTGKQMVSTEVDPGPFDMYRHPELLDPSNKLQARPSSQPKHDIYALGLMLLEIGLWKRLDFHFKADKTPALNTARYITLTSNNLPFYMGHKYCEAVLECLDSARQVQAFAAMPTADKQNRDDDALFLDFFIKNVVGRLET